MKRLILFIVLSILFTIQTCSAAMIATNPNPNDGVTDVDIPSNLTWENSNQTVYVDVYLNDVVENLFPVVQVINHLNVSIYDPPGNLDYDTSYVWRVDLINNGGISTIGKEWRFRTQVPEISTIILLGFGTLIFTGRR